MRRLTALIIMMSVAFFSCSKPPQQGETYFPKTSKGDQWEYALKYQVPTGKVIDGKLLVRNEGNEKINGETYVKNVSLMSVSPDAKPQVTYTRRTDKGIFRLEGNGTEYLATPFPLTVGKRWTVKTSDGQLEFLAEKIEPMKIFDKEYKDSLKVSFQGNKQSMNIEGYSYFAPGVGEIMTFMKINDVIIEYILEKSKLS